MEDRARVAAGCLCLQCFRLVFSPWSSLASGEPVSTRFRVCIVMRGIPDHAWCRSSAHTLLAPFRLIDEIAPETSSGQDMSAFHLSAWTANPAAIPCSYELLLPDRDAVPFDADQDRVSRFARPLLRFPVSIHVE